MSIDTLNFTYDLKEAGIKKSHLIDMLYTKKETYQYDDSGDQKYSYWNGTIISPEYNRDYSVYIDDEKFTFHGSLNKHIKGNNFEYTTQKEQMDLIKALSDVLRVDLLQAKVTRVDFARNFEMNENPTDLMRSIGVIISVKQK